MAEYQQQQAQGYHAFLRVLRNRNFFMLWLSQLISMIGDFFSFLAVPYLITVLAEGSSAAGIAAETSQLSPEAKSLVGLATLAFTLPRLLGIFTGVFVDRWNRHRTIVQANVIAGVIVLAPLLVDSLDAVWIVIAMQFALALATRFIQPTQQAVLPLIVDEDDLLAANGLMSLSMTLGIIIGPLLAGLTVEALGVKMAFVVDCLTFLAAAGIVQFLVRIPVLEDAPDGQGARAIMSSIWEGIRFIFVTPLLLASVISFSLMQGGLGAINAMWVPFLRETFGLGPIGITTVDTAQGIGMALGAVVLGYVMARLSKLVLAAGGLIGIGMALAGMGMAPSFVVVIIMSVVLGILLVPAQSAFNTLLQMAIPKTLQGRVFSSFFAITQATGVAVIALVTALVAAIPLRALYIGGGVVVILAGVLWTVLARKDVQAMETRTGQPEPLSGSAIAAGD